jgi:DNA-binding transcriptional ArsR family regulator
VSDYRVIEEPIFWRRSRSVAFAPTPPPDKPEPVRRPAKVCQQLVLAHRLQAAIERGVVAEQAAPARKLGLTRSRITQLLDLLRLAADLQEQVLAPVTRVQPHRLRALILEDLARFPDSGRADIHRRIGSEIHEKAVARALDALLGEGAIVATGERRWRKYRLADDKGHRP